MKVRDVVRIIEEDGSLFHSPKGSHRQYTHPTKPGRVTIAGNPGEEMHPKTFASVLHQAQVHKPKR
jgi:predicted RNA binding protein YcfA (HicA-like mRNA interferase family)